jgi:hypothetical protein
MNMTEWPGTTIVSRQPDLLEATVGDDLVLLSVEQGSYYALDSIAAAVWQRLAVPASIDEMCTALRERYDVAPDQCEADVRAFLKELDAQHLLRVHPG